MNAAKQENTQGPESESESEFVARIGLDTSDMHCRGADLRGANFSGLDLSEANCRGADLSETDSNGLFSKLIHEAVAQDERNSRSFSMRIYRWLARVWVERTTGGEGR